MAGSAGGTDSGSGGTGGRVGVTAGAGAGRAGTGVGVTAGCVASKAAATMDCCIRQHGNRGHGWGFRERG